MSPLTGVILDVGCGTGGWANELRRRGAETLVGVEPSAEAAAAARMKYDEVWEGTIEDCPLERWSEPDLIVCADILEHLHDPWETLHRLRAIAGPDTRLAVSIPNLRYLTTLWTLGFRGNFEYSQDGGYFDVGHLRWFTRKSLHHALTRSGWKPISSGGRMGARLRRATRNSLSARSWADLLQYQIFAIAIPGPPDSNRMGHGAS